MGRRRVSASRIASVGASAAVLALWGSSALLDFTIIEVGNLVEVSATVRSAKLGEHLGAEDDAHRLDREEERARRWIPPHAVEGETAAGHDGVDVGMEIELASHLRHLPDGTSRHAHSVRRS
jgi:hypothetical protein